jgi:alkaline phosphatase D
MLQFMRRRDLFPLALGVPGILHARPKVEQGAMVGDVRGGEALVWSRADRPSKMRVTWSTSERGEKTVVPGPYCLDVSDFTGRVALEGLPAGQRIVYEVAFEDLSTRAWSEPVAGSFLTPGAGDVRFCWSGDTVGQGWGINPEFGGMKIYEAMRKTQPNFFIHSGDTIYADGPVPAEVKLKDGSVWHNVTTEAKSKVAETLNEFRGAYLYNLMDANVRRFHSEVAQIWQWDDHEVMNNWSDSKDIRDNPLYTEKSVPLLTARGERAFREYAPLGAGSKVYRHIPYGPLVDVFVLDMRSYRGPNTHNREEAETPFLGRPQVDWLLEGLRKSKAVWKVIAADMPIGLLVPDGPDAEKRMRFEATANGNGPALGREIEMARLLTGMKQAGIRNTVWLTADVHYTAAHHYHPDRAKYKDFHPFWEFVAGPLNAGTFGPGQPDDTFGIEVVYAKAPPKGEANLPPSAGMQFFGDISVSAKTRVLNVTLRDLYGNALFSKELQPEKMRIRP